MPAPFGLPIVEASTAHGYDRTAKPPHDSRRHRSAPTVGPSHSCWVGPRSVVGPRPERPESPQRPRGAPQIDSPPPSTIPPPGREPLWLRCLQSVRAEVVFPDPRVDRYRRSTRRSGGHMTEHHTYETRAAGDAPSSAPSPPVRRMAGARNCECAAPPRRATRSCSHCRAPISVRCRTLRGHQTAAKWKPGCCGQRSGRPSMPRSRRAPHSDRDTTSSHQANQSFIPESIGAQQAPRASLTRQPPTATIH